MSNLNTCVFVDADTGLPIPPRPVEHPPLYRAPSLGKLKGFLVDDAEIDQLRIAAIRRCTQMLADLGRLEQRPATLADVLKGRDEQRRLLLATVDFEACEQVEKAMLRLENLLGKDAAVLDPRVEFGPGYCSLAAAREQVDTLTAEMAPYRLMREQLR